MSLGMELHGAKRARGMADALVGPVVGVAEPRLPARGERFLVHGVAVILACDIAAAGVQVDTGLVLAAVAEGEFVCVGAGGQCHDLVAEADAEARHAVIERPSRHSDGLWYVL